MGASCFTDGLESAVGFGETGADALGRAFFPPAESWVAGETVAATKRVAAAKITLFTAAHPPRAWTEAPARDPSAPAPASRRPADSRRDHGRVRLRAVPRRVRRLHSRASCLPPHPAP